METLLVLVTRMAERSHSIQVPQMLPAPTAQNSLAQSGSSGEIQKPGAPCMSVFLLGTVGPGMFSSSPGGLGLVSRASPRPAS